MKRVKYISGKAINLTLGKIYDVIDHKYNYCNFLLKNDIGYIDWYGSIGFVINQSYFVDATNEYRNNIIDDILS